MPSQPSKAHDAPGGRSSFASAKRQTRLLRARKVMAILSDHIDLSKSRVLDVGTGSGIMAAEWAKSCAELQSVDVEDQRVEKKGYTFSLINDEKLPFPDASFDVVISNYLRSGESRR